MPMVTDEQLMHRLQMGEPEVIGELYDRHAPVVFGLLFKMVGNREVAEELLQETFWRVWKNADKFDPEKGRFRTWMFSIARRTAIDKMRSWKVRPQSADGGYAEDALSRLLAADNPADDVALSMQRAAVRDALDELTDDQRFIIEMSYFKGKSRREIAKETGIPLGTVHTRARLALQQLRRVLLERGWEDAV